MHEEWSNCSWIGVMVYIFIFARMNACGGHEDRGFFVQGRRSSAPRAATRGNWPAAPDRTRCLAE